MKFRTHVPFAPGQEISILRSEGTDRGVGFTRVELLPRLARAGYLGSQSGSGVESSRRADDAVVVSCREISRATYGVPPDATVEVTYLVEVEETTHE